ncbi:hypothetical protein LVJ94_36405 [Pendulispora rubella]|uniref:Uncharacterized protein n=1 Tax=Pendulispora rubella TaxID=2741070 RepID=A0ABZ2KZI0_9BACT
MRTCFALASLGTLTAVGCVDFNTARTPPPRGTVGEELYGLLCDRVAAQAIREDLTGASFAGVCHKRADGTYSDAVDTSKLPAIDDPAVRARQLGRVHAMVRRRGSLIAAFDATFPDVRVPVVDEKNGDPKRTCDRLDDASIGDRGKLTQQLSDMLGKLIELYTDGTIPRTTQAMAGIMNDVGAAADTRAALARFQDRRGYKPESVAMGASRAFIGYPRLRDLANASLRLLSHDSDPYAEDAPRDGDGKRVPVPGPAHASFAKLLEVAHEELRTFAPDPTPPALSSRIDAAVRPILSRPRTTLEVVQQLVQMHDPVYAQGDAPLYLVQRDADGNAQLLAANRTTAPSPFPSVNDEAAARDAFGRALIAKGGAPLYATIDTSRTFSNALMKNLPPLLDTQHGALMDMLGGLEVLFGARDGAYTSKRTYGAVSVGYDAYRREASPLLDLVWALGAILGDPSGDDLLALTQNLVSEHLADLARTTNTALAMDAVADRHPEARLPRTSTLWDDVLDVLVEIQRVPGLLEGLLEALSQDDTAAIGDTFANYMKYTDMVSYDRDHINASAYNGGMPYNLTTHSAAPPRTPVNRAQSDTGYNRSIFQRIGQLVTDADGVAVCNKANGVLHATVLGLDVPIPTGAECSFAKIDNLAIAFTQAIAGKAYLHVRNDAARLLANVQLIEASSGLTGFWDGPSSKTLRPRPEFATRLVFWDRHDTKNAKTTRFINDLFDVAGTSRCPERPLEDPCNEKNKGSHGCGGAPASELEVAPDGMIHGLRQCAPGQTLLDQDDNTLFLAEHFGFYPRIRPFVTPFVEAHREDLFVRLIKTFHRHWPSTEPGSSYEPLLIEMLPSDLLPAARDMLRTLKKVSIARCTKVDPISRACTATMKVSGVALLADGLRALLDPAHATALGVKNRDGSTTGLRNDGARTPQVTELYLLLQALNGFDDAFTAWGAKHPGEDRLAAWRRARSQLVDQFLTATPSAFRNEVTPVFVRQVLQLLREQRLARCPEGACTWAREELVRNLGATTSGPLFASLIDVLSAIRSDPAGRAELEKLLLYLTDPASPNDARSTMLTSLVDFPQILADDGVAPLIRTMSTTTDAVDAVTALLARLSGRAFDRDGVENCGRELDPNQVLTMALQNLVTPMAGRPLQAPLDVILDAINEVNRSDPDDTSNLREDDYASVTRNVSEFLIDPQRGLEQFYEIVRNGVK